MKNLKEFMVNEACDQFGTNMQIGDDVVFYYEDGIAEKDNNDNKKLAKHTVCFRLSMFLTRNICLCVKNILNLHRETVQFL